MGNPWPQVITPGLKIVKNQGGLRMSYWLLAFVGEQVLFGNIGHIGRLSVLGQQVIERLVLVWANLFGDRQPIGFGVGKNRIDVENHSPEGENPVFDHLTDGEFGDGGVHGEAIVASAN